MPKLTSDEQSRIAKQFTPILGVGKKCPVCGGKEFVLEDESLVLLKESDPRVGIRLALVHCKDCGHAHLFVLTPR